jgi:hypothetical protein
LAQGIVYPIETLAHVRNKGQPFFAILLKNLTLEIIIKGENNIF